MIKAKELKTKSGEELSKMLRDERAKLRDLNFKLAGSQVKNVSEFSKIKKNIARLLTLLHQKEQHQNA